MKSRLLLAALVGLCTTVLHAPVAHAEPSGPWNCSLASLPLSSRPVPSNFPAAVLWAKQVSPHTVWIFGARARLEYERRSNVDYLLAFPTVSSTAGTWSLTPEFYCGPGWNDAGGPLSGEPRTFTTVDAVPLPRTVGVLEVVPGNATGGARIRVAYSPEFAAYSSLAWATVKVGQQDFDVRYGELPEVGIDWETTQNPGCRSKATSTPFSIAVHIAGTSDEEDPPALVGQVPGACAVVPGESGAAPPPSITDAGVTPDWDSGAAMPYSSVSGGCAVANRAAGDSGHAVLSTIGIAFVVLRLRSRAARPPRR